MWNWIIQIAIYVITSYISYQMRETPEGPDPASLEDFDVPTASEARPIPVVFGTVMVSGSNVVWYGDLRTEEVTSGGGGKK